MTPAFKMTATMVPLCDNTSVWSDLNGPDGLAYLVMQADVHDLHAKIISTASAILHAPIQVRLGALHCTFSVCPT